MAILKKLGLLFMGVFLTCGFADCQFSATNSIYKANVPCKSISGEMEKEKIGLKRVSFESDPGINVYECKKLVKYRASEERGGKVTELIDLYVGLQNSGHDCTIITSSAHIGPVSGTDKSLNAWDFLQKKYTERLFNLEGKIQNVPQSLTFSKGKEEYKKWCDDLVVDTIN